MNMGDKNEDESKMPGSSNALPVFSESHSESMDYLERASDSGRGISNLPVSNDGGYLLPPIESSNDQSNGELNTSVDSSFVSNVSASSVTDSCTHMSEMSFTPIVSEKIHVLVSVLKGIQSNMQEMNNYINDQKSPEKTEDGGSSYIEEKGDLSSIKESPPLGIYVDSSKTDETKLNEILSLLHNITDALSSYEQIPLLAESREHAAKKIRSVETGSAVELAKDCWKDLASQEFQYQAKVDLVSQVSEYHSEIATNTEVDQPSFEGAAKENISKEGSNKKRVLPAERNPHRFSKETMSLRHEIDEAIKRKDALDEKLKLFISQRQSMQDEPEKSSKNSNVFRIETPNKRESVQILNEIEGAPCRSMDNNSENSEGIEDLRRDEEVVLGLAESGLSDEINSLNNTIKEILKENQQYQEFFKDFSADSCEKKDNNTENEVDSYQTKKQKTNLLETCFNESSQSKRVNLSPVTFDECLVASSSHENSFNKEAMSYGQFNAATNGSYNNNFDNLVLIQSSFEAKLKSLVEAQEKTMEVIIREKQTSDERCHNLEKMVTGLIKVQEENKTKYLEEIQVMDVENCRLQDELNNLCHNQTGQTSFHSFNYDTLPIETHSICQAHIEKLSQEKRVLLSTLSQSGSPLKSPSNHRANLSSSSLNLKHKDFDSTSETSDGGKFSSLPNFKHVSRDDVHLTETSNVGTSSLDEELHTLKTRVKFLESYLKRQFCNVPKNGSPSQQEQQEWAANKSENSFLENSSKASDLIEDNRSYVKPSELHNEGVDSSQLYQKIIILMEEKEIMSNKLEELMAVTRELAYHYKNTKMELNNLLQSKREKNRSKRSSVNSGSVNCSSENSTSENNIQEISDTKDYFNDKQILNAGKEESKSQQQNGDQEISAAMKNQELQQKLNEQLLQERIQSLQVDAQKAWSEVQQKTLQIEKLKVDKEKINYFLTSSLSNVEQENLRLQSTVEALREENKILCNEIKSFKGCFKDSKLKEGDLVKENRLSKIDNEESLSKTMNKPKYGEDKETQIYENDIGDGNVSNQVDGKHSFNGNKIQASEANVKWQRSLEFLQKCLVEEKLQSQLLAAADMENSARVAVLRNAVREKGDMCQVLLEKYQKLRHIFASKKAEKRHHQDVLKECSRKMEELNSTTTAIEGNYKVMLSTLGHNIGIAVEILSSHLYFTPTQIHPSPELSIDPAFWFAAQCSRLRWLQSQLRKLCLHTWKTGSGTLKQDKQKCKLNKKLSSELKTRSLDFPLDEKVSSFSSPVSLLRKENETSYQVDLPEKLNLSSLQSITSKSSIFSTLSNAEISLTSQQVKLAKCKTNQFNHLVNLLKENSSDTHRESAIQKVQDHSSSVANTEYPYDDASCATETDSGASNNTIDFSVHDDQELPSCTAITEETYSMYPTKLKRTNSKHNLGGFESIDSPHSFNHSSINNNPFDLIMDNVSVSTDFPMKDEIAYKGNQSYYLRNGGISGPTLDKNCNEQIKKLVDKHCGQVLMSVDNTSDNKIITNLEAHQPYEGSSNPFDQKHCKKYELLFEQTPVIVHREDQ